MSQATEVLSYSVPDVSCAHCRAAIMAEVQAVSRVSAVDVDLEAKRVSVAGEDVDEAAVRAAIAAAGFDIA